MAEYIGMLANFFYGWQILIYEDRILSEKALFKPVKATLNLTAITAMNTAMTNVLLAKMVFKPQGNPVSPTKIIKNASERVIAMVLARVEGELTKAEMSELAEIADAYKEVLKAVE